MVTGKEKAQYEASEYLNLARFQYSDDQAIRNANRYIELCKVAEPVIAKRKEQFESYIQVLIDNGFFTPASFCLDYVVDPQNKISASRVFENQKTEIAELSGNLAIARRLLASASSTANVSADDALKTCELEAVLRLMDGNYEKCEKESRSFESQLFALDDVGKNDENNRTSQDEFVGKYRTGLLARAQALVHLKAYNQALVLLRRIVRYGEFDDDNVIDTFALMTYCYQQTSHPGLALAAEQHAAELIQGSGDFPRRLGLAADAKYRMAQYFNAAGNSLRSRRYFSEALDIAREANLMNSPLYQEIEQSSKR